LSLAKSDCTNSLSYYCEVATTPSIMTFGLMALSMTI